MHLEVTAADIVLDDADFARQSILIGRHGQGDRTARLLSLSRAHVSALVLSGLDLRACRFSGAQGLASMRIEANCRWPAAPSGRSLTARKTISEEHGWRAGRGEEEWDDPATRRPGQEGAPDQLEPEEIAGIYRALRKAREDDKDEAGAGDLYYGEMEMRRHAAGETKSERGIVWGYLLASGYGLRVVPGAALAGTRPHARRGAVLLVRIPLAARAELRSSTPLRARELDQPLASATCELDQRWGSGPGRTSVDWSAAGGAGSLGDPGAGQTLTR